MNIIERYNLYRKLMKSTPSVIERVNSPENNFSNIKWKFDDMYIINSVHDTKYDWHTANVHDRVTNNLIARFSGFWGRKIFNYLGKSL